MRDILFRGKTENGGWAEGSLIRAGSYCCILESEDCVHPSDYPYLDDDLGTIDGYATPVLPETIGQFTGLFDKNNKKIFEGDIVKTKYGRLCVVRWFSSDSYNGWDLEMVNDYNNWRYNDPPTHYDLYNKENLKVVSNIHEKENNHVK